MSKVHKLKTWPKYYYRVYIGQKNFELRKADRDFEIGDYVILQEFDPDKKEYTGRELQRCIGYILQGGQFGLEEGYVILDLLAI
jgi:hypothetical protein